MALMLLSSTSFFSPLDPSSTSPRTSLPRTRRRPLAWPSHMLPLGSATHISEDGAAEDPVPTELLHGQFQQVHQCGGQPRRRCWSRRRTRPAASLAGGRFSRRRRSAASLAGREVQQAHAGGGQPSRDEVRCAGALARVEAARQCDEIRSASVGTEPRCWRSRSSRGTWKASARA